MSMSQAQINARPHAAQAEVHRHPARFRVLDAGRRFGKTRLGVMECIDAAVHGGLAWWVSPTYKMSEVGWRPLRQLSSRIPGTTVSLSERRVDFPSGGSVTIRSADNPTSLRGEGLNFLVMDECAFIGEDAWLEALRPALSDKKGRALFISTPKGLNWFHTVFQRGQEDGGEWQSWRKPTSDNPYIDPTEIEAARQSLPERVFRQEYLAEFLSDGSYFQNVDNAATLTDNEEPDAHAGHHVVGGLDWAMQNDYTVLTLACRNCNRVIFRDRFNQIDYTYQRARVIDGCQRYQVSGLLPERNSIGQPNIELLIAAGIPILPGADGLPGFNTTATTKPALIQRLAGALEHDGFLVPKDYADELRAYEVEVMSSGHPKFGAPDGMHDDRVMSLALAWWAITTDVWLIS
jgi:hypothetical protein